MLVKIAGTFDRHTGHFHPQTQEDLDKALTELLWGNTVITSDEKFTLAFSSLEARNRASNTPPGEKPTNAPNLFFVTPLRDPLILRILELDKKRKKFFLKWEENNKLKKEVPAALRSRGPSVGP